MLGLLRARRQVPTVAVATALCTMLFATCLTAADQPAPKKACCAAMQHDCDDVTLESSCCVVPSVIHQMVMAAKLAGVHAPIAVATAAVPHAAGQTSTASPPSRAVHVSPSPPGVPTYLFVSVLRI